MNPEIKEKWVAALRSGEYSQAKTRLRVDNSFCCLGVLCDIAEKEGIIKGEQASDGRWHYENREGALPFKVVDWADVSESDPVVRLTGSGCWAHLSECNDDLDYNFEQIANIIEEQL